MDPVFCRNIVVQRIPELMLCISGLSLCWNDAQEIGRQRKPLHSVTHRKPQDEIRRTGAKLKMGIKIFHAVIRFAVCLAGWELYPRDTCNKSGGVNGMGLEECITSQRSNISNTCFFALHVRVNLDLPIRMDMEVPVQFGLFIRDDCQEHRIFSDAVKTCNLSCPVFLFCARVSHLFSSFVNAPHTCIPFIYSYARAFDSLQRGYALREYAKVACLCLCGNGR